MPAFAGMTNPLFACRRGISTTPENDFNLLSAHEQGAILPAVIIEFLG